MAISRDELQIILYKAFPNSQIILTDLAGDQDHYSLEITDKSFEGISLLKQHILVKNALGEVLGTKLHALTIKTIVG